MRLPSDSETREEALLRCVRDPSSLVIILVAAYGNGGAANALILRDEAGCPMYSEEEVTRYVNRLIHAGLMQAQFRRNAVLTSLGRFLLCPAQQTQ